MRAKNLTWRRLVTGTFLFAFLMGLVGVTPAVAQDEGQPVAAGTTLTAGQLYVWEDASAWPTSALYFGYADGSFVVDDAGHNAWGPYTSTEGALDGACSTASARLTADGGSFTGVTVNDTSYDASTCSTLAPVGSAPKGSTTMGDSSAAPTDCSSPVTGIGTTVQESDGPLCLAKGTWVVVRTTDNLSGTITIEIRQLEANEAFDADGTGMVVIHVWYGYGSEVIALRNGCGEAKDRAAEAYGDNTKSWDWGYVVQLNGEPVPTVGCKSWAADQI